MPQYVSRFPPPSHFFLAVDTKTAANKQKPVKTKETKNMSNIKISKENFEILNAFHKGNRVEGRRKRQTGDEWFPAAGDLWDFEFYEYRIAEPRIAKGHNPAKLTEDQVGVNDGWRLLDDDEIVKGRKLISRIESWSPCFGWDGCVWGNDETLTYRTKLSKHDLAKDRGLWKEPKRAPKVPNAPVWWVRTANRSFHAMPKIMNDESGTTLGTWQEMQDAGCTWSPDRKRWFNFYGEEVK